MNKKDLSDASANLAKYSSIVVDLRLVKSWLKKILELKINEENDSIVINGLWIASLIVYARCFASGKRDGLNPEEVYSGLNGDPLGLHEYLIEMRNKHIAHSVNPFEQIKVGLVVDNKEQILGTAVLQSRLISFTDKDISQFGKFATHAEIFCAKKAQDLQNQIGEEYQGRNLKDLNLEELRKMGITIPSPTDVSCSR